MNKRRHRSTPAVAALAVGGLLAAGCGSEEPGPQREPTEPIQTASVEASAGTETTKAEAEAESSGEWDNDGDWNEEWDENRPESAKAGDTYHLADGTSYTHAEMEAKREAPEPTFDSTPVEDVEADDLPITEGSFSAE